MIVTKCIRKNLPFGYSAGEIAKLYAQTTVCEAELLLEITYSLGWLHNRWRGSCTTGEGRGKAG